jgi:hypothetical protein
MRNISFSMTTQAFRERRKTVTRRLGWRNLKVGETLMGVEKCQGLKAGEKIVRISAIEVLDTRWEPLWYIINEGNAGVVKEGFPDIYTFDFIQMFMRHNKRQCKELRDETLVNRIEFKYLDLCVNCLQEYCTCGSGQEIINHASHL